MPTYQYRCSDCGHSFDQFQRFADAPLTECPECGGLIKRVLHPVGVVFKGSGWYITDSREAKNGKKSSSDGSDAATEGKASASESKPAAVAAES